MSPVLGTPEERGPRDDRVDEVDGKDERLERLERELALLDRVVVAFSGGADSSLLAAAATRRLGADQVRCVTAVSPSLAPEELEDCAAFAAEWGLRWSTVETRELDVADYAANGLDRCYHCKVQLMEALAPIAAAEGAVVALGVNLDDLDDHRPGQRAARSAGAAFPLVGAGLTKAAVRDLSRALGLRTWDKPAAACLASRVPHGTAISAELLGRLARAESALRRIGFRALRVRHYGDLARVELPAGDLARAVERRDEVVAAVHGAGYRYVTLDLEGLRPGNLARAALEAREHARAGS